MHTTTLSMTRSIFAHEALRESEGSSRDSERCLEVRDDLLFAAFLVDFTAMDRETF